MVAFVGALWQAYETSKREAAVFASEAQSAFSDGYCDRAMRFALAGLPPTRGAFPLAYFSGELDRDLLQYPSAYDCPIRLALTGHQGAVLTVIFNNSGSRALTASADKTANIWNLSTGEKLSTLMGHLGPVNEALFSPDESRVLTVSDDKSARLWDASTGMLLKTLSGHTAALNSAAFSADGRRVATASDDLTVRIWNADTGILLKTLAGHGRRVRTVAFNHDGRRLLTASNDQTARLWDAE